MHRSQRYAHHPNSYLVLDLSNITKTFLQVCGTDRVTYDSRCHLQTLSANARVDHMGACEEDTSGMMTWMQLCEKTKTDNKCPRTDCMSRVMPREGCCPICGEFVWTQSPVNYFYSNYGHLGEIILCSTTDNFMLCFDIGRDYSARTHVHTHTHTHACNEQAHTHKHECNKQTHIHLYAKTNKHTHAYTHTRMHTHTYTHTHTIHTYTLRWIDNHCVGWYENGRRKGHHW